MDGRPERRTEGEATGGDQRRESEMPARLATVAELVWTSLWFIPALMAMAAAMVAWAAIEATGPLPARDVALWTWHSGTARDAATLTAALLTALITMASLAVSITMVVLTLAAGQLGPRLIRNFMGDRRTQFAIGFFLAGIVYLVLVHRSLREDMPEESVPHLAVTGCTVMLLLCVGVLLLFTHHLARSIVSDTVIARVGDALDRTIDHLTTAAGAGEIEESRAPPSSRTILALPVGGYVQSIDCEGLVTLAREHDCRFDMAFRPGHHLFPGGHHIRVDRPVADPATLSAAARRCVAVGTDRTANEDPEFSIRQLVEVALRALSPGINDPFTAIVVIDRLGLSLARAMSRDPIPRIWRDDDGVVRLTVPMSTFRGIVDASLNQIRQSAGSHPDVLIHMADMIGRLGEIANREMHRGPLERHLSLVLAAGRRGIEEPADLAELEDRASAAGERLSEPGTRTAS